MVVKILYKIHFLDFLFKVVDSRDFYRHGKNMRIMIITAYILEKLAMSRTLL